MSSVEPEPPPVAIPAATRPLNRLGVVALVLALVGLAVSFIPPFALLAWIFSLPAFIVAIVALTRKNRRKKLATAGVILSSLAFVASLVTFSVYSADVASHSPAKTSSNSTYHSTVSKKQPAPTATPLPTVPDVSLDSPADGAATLTADGYQVALVDTSGAVVTDPAGYTFVSESPAAGTALTLGSTVTITVSPGTAAGVPTPVPSHPANATALCKDGTYAYNYHPHDQCEHHGGIEVRY